MNVIELSIHDKQIREKAINEFAHELKETFNGEIPSSISCYAPYFSLDDLRMWVDATAEMLKEQNK